MPAPRPPRLVFRVRSGCDWPWWPCPLPCRLSARFRLQLPHIRQHVVSQPGASGWFLWGLPFGTSSAACPSHGLPEALSACSLPSWAPPKHRLIQLFTDSRGRSFYFVVCFLTGVHNGCFLPSHLHIHRFFLVSHSLCYSAHTWRFSLSLLYFSVINFHLVVCICSFALVRFFLRLFKGV